MSTPTNFAWYELMTTDTAAAGTFYSSVVGWSTHDVGTANMPYTSFNLGEKGVAGLMSLPEAAGPTPAWVGYIHFPDVDAHLV
jgi:predicted enzyme related to lactoylglutathione lyase